MNSIENYLEDLNRSFEKYYKTKNLYAYKKFMYKLKEGKQKYNLNIQGYDTGYLEIKNFSIMDLSPQFAEQIKDFKKAYRLWVNTQKKLIN